MTGLKFETVSKENHTTQFIIYTDENSPNEVQEFGEVYDHYKQNLSIPQKWQLVLNTSHVSGDAKPPLRLRNVPPPKSGPEILAILNEKQRQTSLRRDQYMNNVVQKSRKNSEKVLLVRQKMAEKLIKFSQNIENNLQQKRRKAEGIREQISQSKLNRIKTHMEHAKIVRTRKMANDNQSISPGRCSLDESSPLKTQSENTE